MAGEIYAEGGMVIGGANRRGRLSPLARGPVLLMKSEYDLTIGLSPLVKGNKGSLSDSIKTIHLFNYEERVVFL